MEDNLINVKYLLSAKVSEIEQAKTNKYLLSREEFIKKSNNISDD